MPKPSVQVQLIHAQAEIKRLQYELANARLVSTLFCADAAVIAAHNVFKRQGGIIADFREEYHKLCAKRFLRPLLTTA